jgi:hypothetical protein
MPSHGEAEEAEAVAVVLEAAEEAIGEAAEALPSTEVVLLTEVLP